MSILTKCHRAFGKSKERKLLYLAIHFLKTYNFNIRDIVPLISKHIVFNYRDHIGGFIPLYYQSGLPCRTWTCVSCKELFSEYDEID